MSMTSFATEIQMDEMFDNDLEDVIKEPSSVDPEVGILTELAKNSPTWNPFKPPPSEGQSINSSVAPTEEGIKRPRLSAVGLKKKIMRGKSLMQNIRSKSLVGPSRNQFRNKPMES
mmetsp:Transcript_20822/g.32128  ORF Transcript_20822/g.32128 Transcript_20822/m.32128 type:complete len:116 (+) Transcript_20822:1156-1503(+)